MAEVIKKETVTINEDQFALASANVIKRLSNTFKDDLNETELELLKVLCVNFSGELFMELFVEITKDNEEEVA